MYKRLLSVPVLLAAVGGASAGLLPAGLAVTRQGDGDAYRFVYSVELQSKAVLKPGDFFTVYDFAGYIDGTHTQPAGFTFSSETVGKTPAYLSPNDDPAVPNLTWTYTGTTPITGDKVIGQFGALSEYGDTRADHFTGQSHKEMGGCYNNNITDTCVPVPSNVPEPAAWALAAAGGLAAVLFAGWRRLAV